MELPASADTGGTGLIAGALSIRQVLFFGFAALGISTMLALNAGSLLYISGDSSWLAVLIGTVVMLFVAAPIIVFARRHTVTGSLVSLLGEEFGARWRPVPGAALLGGYIVTLVAFACATVLYLGSFLDDIHVTIAASRGFQFPVLVAVVLLSALLAYWGIAASVKVTIGLGLCCLPLVILIVVASAISSGVHLGPQLRLEGVTASGLVNGVFFMVASFCGFEGLTSLGRETRNAHRGIPVVMLTLLSVGGLILLLGTFTEIPLLAQHIDALNQGVSPSAVLADIGHVGWIKAPTDLLIAVGALAGTIGYTNDAARVTATMGRDGGLPAWIGKIDPARRTPARAAWVLAALTIIVLAVYLSVSAQGLLLILTNTTILLAYLWFIAYMVSSVGGVVLGLRRGTRSAWTVILSALSLASVVGCYAWSISQAGGGFDGAAPWMSIGWVAAGTVVIAVSERRRARARLAASTAPAPDAVLSAEAEA
jgi:amino acid transporter